MRHRMALALEHAGVSVGEMAEDLDLHRVTVSGWMHGRSNPPTSALKIWALRTGVDYQWLISGKAPEDVQTPASPDLRLTSSSSPKAAVGDTRRPKRAARRSVTDNKDSSEQRPKSRRRSRVLQATESHSYPENKCQKVQTGNRCCRVTVGGAYPSQWTGPSQEPAATAGLGPRRDREGSVRWLLSELTCCTRSGTRTAGTDPESPRLTTP